jgi:hypothetical protein
MPVVLLPNGTGTWDRVTLFREALAWGMTYGPQIPAHQWDAMRETMVAQFVARTHPAPQQAVPAYQRALDIRAAQGWKLGGDKVPVLYTDTINGEQVCRDDVWLCTTAAFSAHQQAVPTSEQAGAPSFRTLPDGHLYAALNDLLSHIGMEGVVTADNPFVLDTMAALKRIDGGVYLDNLAIPTEPDAYRADMLATVGLLEDGEWTEHHAKTPLGMRLEDAISKLHNELHTAPASGGAAPVAEGDALSQAACWNALSTPSDETIVEAMEASCAHRPSVDDDSYVLRILHVFMDAARVQAKEGGAA